MESYLVIKPDNSSGNKSYRLTTNANKPRLNVSNSYIPLTTQGKEGTNVKIKDGNTAYRLMEYSTVSSSSSMQTTETTGYSGVLSRQSNYYATSGAPGVMSNVTNLTRESVSGYSGISSRASTYGYSGVISETASMRCANGKYAYPFITLNGINYGATLSATYYNQQSFTKVQPFVVTYASHNYGGGWIQPTLDMWVYNYNGYNAGTYTGAYFLINTGDSAHLVTLINIDTAGYTGTYCRKSYTTSPSYFNGAGAMTQQSNYYTSSNAVAGMWNVTNLTRQSVSGYSGVLSRQSNYNYTSAVPGSMSSVTALTASSSSSTSASTTSYV